MSDMNGDGRTPGKLACLTWLTQVVLDAVMMAHEDRVYSLRWCCRSAETGLGVWGGASEEGKGSGVACLLSASMDKSICL